MRSQLLITMDWCPAEKMSVYIKRAYRSRFQLQSSEVMEIAGEVYERSEETFRMSKGGAMQAYL